MTATATEVIGPVVRMCGDDPGCGGAQACERVTPLMGLTECIDPARGFSDEGACAILCQDIALNAASDDSGVRHMIPDGCEFLVHKVTDLDGRLAYTAVYSGPAADRDAALADAPLFDWDAAVARMKRMRAAGVFDAAFRDRERQREKLEPDVTAERDGSDED